MARARKPATPTPVESVRHQDKRVNIPTDELRDFVVEAEQTPTSLVYPRDPSLDPQLVWKGKDEQDREDLTVPAVPIYIQEKIDPRVLVENLRTTAAAGEREPELLLFERFDGLEFEELVDFYRHDVNWSNRMILGDSLLVMASLAEKENLKGKVQMIYLDPPYGIRFGSNFQVSTRKRDVKDGKAEDLTRQPEQIRAFRDTWELGIHSYLSYLRDRFTVALDLLTESGSIFVQIGDENVHLVRSVLDEVFGSEHFISLITYSKTAGATGEFLSGTADFVLWYAKDRERAKYRSLYAGKEFGGEGSRKYDQLELADGSRRPLTQEERLGVSPLPPDSRVYRLDNLTSQSVGREKGEGAASWFAVQLEGREFTPTSRSRWKTNEAGMRRLLASRRVQVTTNTLAYVRFINDFAAFPLTNTWMDIGGIQSRVDPKVYVVQTATKAIERCMLMTTDPGDLVLDPTCGSGTTAYVGEQWGRRWITIDTSRVALALARTRIMAAKYPYYLLSDSSEGATREAELTGVPTTGNGFSDDVRKGFVCKRVPHLTLKSIAQNPDINEGMTREQIDAAIARHAETEMLVDQPFEDRRRVRVSGPFTVESLSPHRVLDEDMDRTAGEQSESEAGTFVEMILSNLRKAGVENTKREERLTFDWLESFAGEWVHGEGEFTDSDGVVKRVAVSIGPEHGTVGPLQVKEAAKEAVKGRGFDILVVCGFAFDARVGETAREFGKLVVLAARMNPDLAMGDELLKKTGAGNLFMVFGEPDLTVKQGHGKVTIELRGVDVYDPTSGEVRSSSTDDVACWFVDTDYNGESFFVRHAYFTGAGDPYERLRRALRADIDEAAWSTLYSTVSRPFDPPSTGKIAVKVINHYGDEVMHVYDIEPLTVSAASKARATK
jgi:adenine-specific DNA-methyltransferase